MKTITSRTQAFLLMLLPVLTAPLIHGQSTAAIALDRTQYFSQSSAGAPTAHPMPFTLNFNVRGSGMEAWEPAFYKPGSGGVPQAGSSTATNTGTLNFSATPNNGDDFQFYHDFATNADLLAFYPIGQYGVKFPGPGLPPAGTETFTAGLVFASGVTYSSTTPQVTSVTNGATWSSGVLRINPTGVTELNLSNFTTEYNAATYGAVITAGIYDQSGNVVDDVSVEAYNLPTLSHYDTPITKLTLDGAWLLPGVAYTLEIQYIIIASPPEEGFLNGENFQGVASYIKNTSISISTAATTSAPPAVSFSLSSQTGMGQTVSINLSVTDPNNDYAYANLWVHTPNRGWLAIKADNSVVASNQFLAANNVASTAGNHTRAFTFTPTDGTGTYTFAMSAIDHAGNRTNTAYQYVTVANGQAPIASFTLSPERGMNQTVTINLNVNDVDGNYSYANLWVRTPNRGWLAIKADNSVVVSDQFLSVNNVALTAGAHIRTFTFTPTDGTGTYTFAMSAIDASGLRTNTAYQYVTVANGQAPTASFSLSSANQLNQTITITLNVNDADGDYNFANLWVRTPNRGWVAIKADNSVVVSDQFLAANNVSATAGVYTRTFTFTPTDGTGTYTFALSAIDNAGLRVNTAYQYVTVTN